MNSMPRSRTADKRYYGVVEGLVTDNADPDKEGKIKVKFPWFDEGTISEWCRIMQPYAGGGYGMFFVPEVGDEVVVSFAHGDMRLPIILGGVYNGNDKPPIHRDASTDQKRIQTKGGHQILLNDTKDRHEIKITTNGGHIVEMDDQGKAVNITTSSGQSVNLDDQGNSVTLTTSGGQSIKLDPSGVTISAAMVTIDAQSINLGKPASSPLVLGDQLLTMFNTHTHLYVAPPSPTPVPTGPPVVPLTPAVLSLTSKTS